MENGPPLVKHKGTVHGKVSHLERGSRAPVRGLASSHLSPHSSPKARVGPPREGMPDAAHVECDQGVKCNARSLPIWIHGPALHMAWPPDF